MTDRWGEIPYSEALHGQGNFSPSYDTQRDIYIDLLKELTEAADQIDDGAPVVGDFILDGDMDAWGRFANFLRMTLALRMSEVEP